MRLLEQVRKLGWKILSHRDLSRAGKKQRDEWIAEKRRCEAEFRRLVPLDGAP